MITTLAVNNWFAFFDVSTMFMVLGSRGRGTDSDDCNIKFNILIPFYAQFLKDFMMQAIFNAAVSVDTFFFLSGTLVAYLTFKELDRSKGRINWFMFYVHRYIR